MRIPQEIQREHILQAIEEVQQKKYPDNRESTGYDLVFENRRYPPKVLISLAYKYVSGEPLSPSGFSGGNEANSFLEKRGF